MKEKSFKMGSPELTLDFKEIMLNTEGYFKVTAPKRTDLMLIILYFFAGVGIINTVMWYIYRFTN